MSRLPRAFERLSLSLRLSLPTSCVAARLRLGLSLSFGLFVALVGCREANDSGSSASLQSADSVPAPSYELSDAVKTLNGRRWDESSSRAANDQGFRFLAGGHLYGRHGDDQPRPAATFQRAIPRLARSDAAFLLALGDTFADCIPRFVDPTVEQLKRLPFPAVGVVGNHDLLPQGRWQAEFGPLFHRFRYGRIVFFVLDAESSAFSIEGIQLDLLLKGLNQARLDPEIRGVVLATHRVFWADTEDLAIAALSSNDVNRILRRIDEIETGPPFRTNLRPALEALAREKQVLCLAGDAGAFPRRTHELYSHREASSGIHFVSVGIGDRERDCLIEVEVSAAGSFQIRPIPLGEEAPKRLAERSPAYWRSRFFPGGLPPRFAQFLQRK